MYRAKAAGRSAIRCYDRETQTDIAAKMVLETGLRESVKDKLFKLYYQPQLDMDDHIVGAETLVRWSTRRTIKCRRAGERQLSWPVDDNYLGRFVT